ncbi:MAG: hypothetical protein HQL26_09760 [Candidatus Omnitrophica bacterium]|nr:hypothetical protein [Candidatus Omnitrophota bacterium]
MKINNIVVIVTVVLLVYGSIKTFASTGANSGVDETEFEHSFFPIETARHNGYEITNANWNDLSEIQKAMFISEGVAEIQRKENIVVRRVDGWQILHELDNSLAESAGERKIPVIEFLRSVLDPAIVS